MFSFVLAAADGPWILSGAGSAVRGNCQGLPLLSTPSPVYYEKRGGRKGSGPPIHFTDEQTETSNIE